MRRRFLQFAAAVAVVTVAGCAATPVPRTDLSRAVPDLRAGEGRIYFFRSASILGAAVQPAIRLDGEVVGKAKPGGFFYVDRPAGDHVASARTETSARLSFTLRAGETLYVRASLGWGVLVGRLALELESPEKALAEIASLEPTGN